MHFPDAAGDNALARHDAIGMSGDHIAKSLHYHGHDKDVEDTPQESVWTVLPIDSHDFTALASYSLHVVQ